jgi:hypothetical protein
MLTNIDQKSIIGEAYGNTEETGKISKGRHCIMAAVGVE